MMTIVVSLLQLKILLQKNSVKRAVKSCNDKNGVMSNDNIRKTYFITHKKIFKKNLNICTIPKLKNF